MLLCWTRLVLVPRREAQTANQKPLATVLKTLRWKNLDQIFFFVLGQLGIYLRVTSRRVFGPEEQKTSL